MSISTLLVLLIWYGAYKLGAFNERHPGRAWELCREWTLWVWAAMSK